jgi:hypothetical protein
MPHTRKGRHCMTIERADGAPIVHATGDSVLALVDWARLLVVRADGSSYRMNRTVKGIPTNVLVQVNRVKWIPLRRKGKWNRSLRRALRRRAGVYAIKLASERTVRYVGESHTGRWTTRKGQRVEADPNRMLRTILRHFQAAFTPRGQANEWTYHGSEDLDVAVWLTAPKRARELEGKVILELEPRDNDLVYLPADATEFDVDSL